MTDKFLCRVMDEDEKAAFDQERAEGDYSLQCEMNEMRLAMKAMQRRIALLETTVVSLGELMRIRGLLELGAALKPDPS